MVGQYPATILARRSHVGKRRVHLINALLMFAPHVAIAPGLFITLTVFAFNMLGDTLRDVLDPRLRGIG
jgi:hypothetical protein